MKNKILSQVHLDIDTDLHILHLLTSTSCLFPLINCSGLEKLKGKILMCAWLHTDELHWVNMVGFVTQIFRALWSFTYCYHVEKGKGQLNCLMLFKSKFLWNDSFCQFFTHWRMRYKSKCWIACLICKYTKGGNSPINEQNVALLIRIKKLQREMILFWCVWKSLVD